jgi:hypothetical protein
MPASIKMSLTNGNLTRMQINLLRSNQPSLAQVPARTGNISLNTPMITRVHNVRPGCGSCGRH